MTDYLTLADATDVGHMAGWGWGMMALWSLLAVAAVVSLIWVFSRGATGQASPAETNRPDPEQLLAERFARGEIDEEEFSARRAALRSAE